MTAYYKTNNAWSKLAPYGKLNGVWSQAKEAYVNEYGTWKQYWLNSGVNDSYFNVEDNVGTLVSSSSLVYDGVVQSDGKLIIVGLFTYFGTTSVGRIARLNTNSSLDTSFSSGTGFNGGTNRIISQSDGKLIVIGNFTSYNGSTANNIIRLNSDGTRDTSFTSSNTISSSIEIATIQSDGKILIGGQFTTLNGSSQNRIARLNSDGTLDTSFTIGTGFDNTVSEIVVQSDGKILVGGFFTTYNGNSASRIIRLNSDGSVDTSFITGTGFGGLGASYTQYTRVAKMVVQSDSKILVGGTFLAYNGTTQRYFSRLNSDGSLDTSFVPSNKFATVYGDWNGSIYSIYIEPDGKLTLGGSFQSYDGYQVAYLVRLNTDGTRDTSFPTGFVYYGGSGKFIKKADDSLLIFGGSLEYNDKVYSNILNISSSAVPLSTFPPLSGFSQSVTSLTIQPDNKILVGGQFITFNGFYKNRIARLNSDGSLDTSFNTGIGFNGTVYAIVVQPDNKILVGGQFGTFNGSAQNYLVRLNSDGSLDSSFNIGTGFNNEIRSIALLSDGKILVGGSFTSYNGTSINRIIKLNSNGSIDTSFNPGTGFNNLVRSITIQPDNKILVGGNFTTFNGSTQNYLIRLNSDGTLDSSFNIGTGFTNAVFSVALLSDGKILVGGDFTSYNGTARSRIIKLNSDGTVDSTFIIGNGFDGSVYDIKIQSNGKIVVGGFFSTYDVTGRRRIARLNADGSLDTNFNIGTGLFLSSDLIYSMAIDNNKKILAGGLFFSYNGKIRNNLLRVGSDLFVPPPTFTSSPTSSSVAATSATISWASTNQTAYSITFSPSVSGQPFTGTTATSRSITGLTEETNYTATVTISTSEDSISQSTSFSTPIAPQPSFTSSPTASSIGVSSATISWGATNQANYSITFSPSVSGQPFTGTTATSRSITGLTSGTNYTATVQIINGTKTASQNVSFSTGVVGETVSSTTYVAPTTTAANITTKTGNTDDGYYTLSLPFTTYFNGVGYNQIYVGTNSYVTFGGGATNYSGLGATVPAFPKIMINAADRGSVGIYYTSDASSWTMRYEGSTGTAGTPTTIIWELYCLSSDPKTMRLSISQTPGGGTTGVYSATELLASLAGGVGTSWNLVSI